MLLRKQKLGFTVYLTILYHFASAQRVDSMINLYGTNFPQEKIHIHFDKESYLPGETIWFKAYLFEDNLPGKKSTNFYAGLYDENGKLVQQQLCPIFSSTASGYFTIPDSLPDRQLICRAYTTWMQNFDSSFLYTKAIKLINNDAKNDGSLTEKKVSLQFFPEGGDIIEGTKNTIAFKANYNNGLPFEINGVLKKQETGEVLMPVSSVHDGMGRFDIDITSNEKYYVEWTDDKASLQQTYLPIAKATGVSLKLALQKDKLTFNIVNKLPSDSLHVLMYMYQNVFYRTDLSVSAELPYTNSIITGSLPSGTMQVTVFDVNWQPVAERIAFINNNNYSLAATISNKESSTQKRGKNIIEIAVPDTIPANMSLSITDADLNNETGSPTIVTDFLLGGDLKGYIHDPAYYFSGDAGARANLDLVMLTHGWRRYNWNILLAGRLPQVRYPVDDYLSVYGQMNKELVNAMDKDELVNLIVKTKDSTQNFYQLHPDVNGLLKKEGLVFYDTARISYSFKKNKSWNSQMTFSNSNYTFSQPGFFYNSRDHLIPDTTGIKFSQSASQFSYFNKNKAGQPGNNEKTLEAVVVKSGGWHNWKNNPIIKMDEKYTTGLFRSGGTNESFDVAHDEMASAKQDIYNYMIGKVAGLTIDYSNGKNFKSSDQKGIMIFLDQNEIDSNQLDQLNIDDIAYIKYIDRYVGRQDIPHAIAIYLKKGEDRVNNHPKDTDQKRVMVPGYSPQKEFYSPDYSKSNTGLGTDARTTLLWMPYILTDKNNLKIPVTFFNNDFSKRLKIVLEGMNEEGKIVHIEKTIE